MKKWILLFLLIPSVCFADAAIIGDEGSTVAGGETTYTMVHDPTDADGNGNVEISTDAFAMVYDPSETFDMTRTDVIIACDGSCTGTVYLAVYDAATAGENTAPDDRVEITSIGATGLADESTPTGYETFTWSSAPTMTSGEYRTIVIWHDGTGTAVVRDHSFGEDGTYLRSGLPPGTTNDAANWGAIAAGDSIVLRTYKSP